VRTLLDELAAVLGSMVLPMDDGRRFRSMERLGHAGQRHREAIYAGAFGSPVPTPRACIRAFLDDAARVCQATITASRRPDGLFHSYDVLAIEHGRARISHLGPMLEGQVAVLDSGVLQDGEAVKLLRALRDSGLYRADQRSYLLYPDRRSVPFLERNTLPGPPPLTDPSLFVVDRDGRWHFQGDLATLSDVDRRLESLDAEPSVQDDVRDLWRATFGHAEFTGRSDRFFMFEGLGSIYWHMVAKLAVAVQWCFDRATEPDTASALARLYHDIRDGLGFRKDPALHGAFPTDPYSHTPRHLGAQQPGMTGQVKEDVLSRFGELGLRIADGMLRFDPSLLTAREFLARPQRLRFRDVDSEWQDLIVPARALAFTWCQVPIVYRLVAGASPTVTVTRHDGATETLTELSLSASLSSEVFRRSGRVRQIALEFPPDALLQE
jgi:hypothetical protein